jgi:alpha-1,3-rhamnosyltransferase
MSTPLVTVIISSYNHAAYIEASIRSVLDQTYPNIELLVYDDGSRDNSVEIIQRLADEYGFFFQPQPNRGLSATLNAGIEKARGEFIAPFGSDDIMFTDRFARQVPWLMARPEVGIAAGNIIKIDEHGQPHRAKRQRRHSERELDFDDMFRGRKQGPPTATLLFRKQALADIGGFNPQIRLEDLYVELKITERGWKIGVMADALAYYRVHPTNTVKDLRFMHEAVMTTNALFAHHPGYAKVRSDWINHQFLRASNRDKQFARECLRELPLRAWNMKTLRGIWRLISARLLPGGSG